MARPAALPTWASNVNYSGGPLAGSPTKIAPSAGRLADGWRPQDLPPSQEENYTQALQNEWITYLDEPRRINTTSYPLASRTTSRMQRNPWQHFAAIWSHTECVTSGPLDSLVFDLTTGAGAGTVAHKVLDLPQGSQILQIAIVAQAGTGHTALPDNHKARFRLVRVHMLDGTSDVGAFRTDPSASTGIYEGVHSFTTDTAWQVDASVTFGVYPIPVDNTQFIYVLQYNAEEGTGTTVTNGYRVISAAVDCTVTSVDDGA